MERITIDGNTYMVVPYKDFAANNLSEHGLAVFEYDREESILIKEYLDKNEKLTEVLTLTLKTYNLKEKTTHNFFLLINYGKLSPFAFFDELRFICSKLSIYSQFYACDYSSDKIFKANVQNMSEIGRLYLFPKILGIDENNKIVFQYLRWVSPKGYYYFTRPSVFRNEAEKAFYTNQEKIMGTFDTFYSFEECKQKPSGDLIFDKAILEFDIDNPNLTVKANILKARNLNVNNLEVIEDLYCSHLKCKSVKAKHIYTESIECENLNAEVVKTNFQYGIKFE